VGRLAYGHIPSYGPTTKPPLRELSLSSFRIASLLLLTVPLPALVIIDVVDGDGIVCVGGGIGTARTTLPIGLFGVIGVGGVSCTTAAMNDAGDIGTPPAPLVAVVVVVVNILIDVVDGGATGRVDVTRRQRLVRGDLIRVSLSYVVAAVDDDDAPAAVASATPFGVGTIDAITISLLLIFTFDMSWFGFL
jgi:hypothetical protein